MRKRATGSWAITVSAGFDPVTGRRQQRYRTVQGTKRDAERELTKMLRDLDTNRLADPGKITVGEHLASYLEHARSRVRPRTWTRYQQLARVHILPRIGDVRLAKLRPAHVQGVVDGMLAGGSAAQTVLHAYRVLSASLRHAVRLQLLAVNPAQAVQPPRPDRPAPNVPEPETVRRLLADAEGTSLHLPVVLAATTGMRRGEVLGLRWSAVDLDAALVRVVASLQRVDGEFRFLAPKTDRARRTITLPPLAVDVLRRHRKDQAERRLRLGEAWQDLDVVVDRGDGGPVDPDGYSLAFAAFTRRLGLHGVRLHDLRHAFATTLLAAGVPPKVTSEALGHASAAFTMDVYQHVLPAMQEQAAAAVQAALGGGGSGGVR